MTNRVEPNTWKNYEKLTSLIGQSHESSSMLELCWTLLDLYQRALDSTDEAVAFLRYWQILENITSPQQQGRGIETRKLISRLN